MPDVIAEGVRVMTVCNSCRYCEGFCAVFPAMEQRLSFAEADMNYLANLCHNCTECLHACQYAAPHPFAVNVPRVMAQIRNRSYEKYSWPRILAVAFRRRGVGTMLALSGIMMAVMLATAVLSGGRGLGSKVPGQLVEGRFYAVIPHSGLVGIFGAVGLYVLLALVMSVRNFLSDTASANTAPAISRAPAIGGGLIDALRLRYLHGSGHDCTIRESVPTPWRRWFHHLTFYGFLLCIASTSVAALYHLSGRQAPYPLASFPVMLGALGGVGLIAGPVGLWMLRQRRDPRGMDPERRGLDESFILALVLTAVTGMALLALRDSASMGLLLIMHLGFVLALFLTLPYGKFVHGLYRVASLIRYHRESADYVPRNQES
jgi:citrate/tricarballylate utilization protein